MNISLTNFQRKCTLLTLLWALTANFFYSDALLHWVYLVAFSFLVSLPQLKLIHLRANTWLIALLSLSIYSILAYYFLGYSSSLLRTTIASTLLISILPSIINYRKYENLLWFMAFATAIGSFFYCFYQVNISNLSRGNWSINPIPYTTFTACVGVIGFYLSFITKNKFGAPFSTLIPCISLSTILLSQTRGTLLALACAVTIATFLLFLKQKLCTKRLLIHIALSFLVTMAFQNKIEQRLEQSKNDYSNIESGKLNSSVGHRFQMWLAGFHIIKEHGIIGIGDDHKKLKLQLANEGLIDNSAVKYTHYHNQFIDSLVKYGLIGLFFILFLLFYPVISYFRHPNNIHTLGLLVSTVFFVAALTDVPLHHGQTFAFFVVIQSILSAPTGALNNGN